MRSINGMGLAKGKSESNNTHRQSNIHQNFIQSAFNNNGQTIKVKCIHAEHHNPDRPEPNRFKKITPTDGKTANG